jgi:hypothetical protein
MKVDPLDPDATMAGRQTQPLRHPGDVDAAGGGEPHQQLAAQPAATGRLPRALRAVFRWLLPRTARRRSVITEGAQERLRPGGAG